MSVPDPAKTLDFRASPEAVIAVTAQGRPQIIDLHRDVNEGPAHLSIYIPIYSSLPQGGIGPPLGVVVFWVDPEQYLYPYILKWPGPSASAETLLVRREGDTVQYLNDLKFDPEAALTLSFPLSRTEVPAVQAVLGREGIVEGRDYRGVPVLAALRAIPDSPWFLVARMDLSEIYAPGPSPAMANPRFAGRPDRGFRLRIGPDLAAPAPAVFPWPGGDRRAA